jgi:hypothetical protein
VQSKFFGVGTVVPWAKANVGAVATQSYANITYGTKGLSLWNKTFTLQSAIMQLTKSDDKNEYRQVGMIDAQGVPAHLPAKNVMHGLDTSWDPILLFKETCWQVNRSLRIWQRLSKHLQHTWNRTGRLAHGKLASRPGCRR